MEEVNLLTKVPVFTSLKPVYITELATKLTTRHYRRGETIFHKDDPGSILYIIKTGQVKIATPSLEGEEVILAILAANDFFGELSLLDGRPRAATATAMEDTQVLTLHRDDLLDVIGKHSELAADMLAALSERLRRTNVLLEDVIYLDLPTRLRRRLLELGEKHGLVTKRGIEIDLRLTQQDLANFVGASRVAINKLLGVFQDKGLICIDKKRIIILRPEEMRKQIH
jgi:CRP/FNR family cyclic AMP-dependent transcriptional regulator